MSLKTRLRKKGRWEVQEEKQKVREFIWPGTNLNDEILFLGNSSSSTHVTTHYTVNLTIPTLNLCV